MALDEEKEVAEMETQTEVEEKPVPVHAEVQTSLPPL